MNCFWYQDDTDIPVCLKQLQLCKYDDFKEQQLQWLVLGEIVLKAGDETPKEKIPTSEWKFHTFDD